MQATNAAQYNLEAGYAALQSGWVARAERANVNPARLPADLPQYDLCEAFAGLHVEFGRPISTRAQQILDAADEAAVVCDDAPDTRAPPPDTSPLTPENCEGRRALVPKEVWPSFECDEHNGRGWTVDIINYSKRLNAATIAFVHATTPRGIPYEDATLRLDVLTPL
jgi:hypothetical protein